MDEQDVISPQESPAPELEGIDLEDIMKEFSSQEEDAAPQAQQPEENQEQAAPEQPELEATQVMEPVAEEPEDKEKTRRLPKIKGKKRNKAESETKPLPQISEETQKIPTTEQMPEASPPETAQEPEYVPYKPILFQPKDRLRALKRKLVAGPEKRYYELSEIGVGKLQIAMVLSLLVFLVSGIVTAMDALGYVPPERLRLMVFVQFFGMLLAAALGCYQMMEGVGDLFRGRFSMNTLLAISFCVCCADSVFCFREERVPCCAAFSLQVTMSLWGAYHKRVTEMGQMDTLRKASRIYAVYGASDFHEGHKGLLRGEGDVDDFMQNYQDMTGPEKAVAFYGIFALLACIGVGVAGGVLQQSVSFGVQVAASGLLAAMPVTAFITLSRPQSVLQKKLHGVGGVICGWQGVKGMSGKAYFAMSHEDLFPTGTCKLNGVKFFSNRDRSLVISYAWVLVDAVGGALAPLFDHLLETQSGNRYPVQNLRTYSNGGVGGEVQDESVLVGTQSFLKDMGVEVPEGIRVNQAVYIAVDGELCGLVAVTYVKNRDQAVGVGTLCAHRGLSPALTTGDFMLTEEFIHSKFNVNSKRIFFPESQVRRELAAKKPDKDYPALAITTHDNIVSYAYCVAGARALKTAQTLGIIVHFIAGIVGIGMMAALAVLGSVELLTPSNMLLYQLVWLIPGLLLTEWTRHI